MPKGLFSVDSKTPHVAMPSSRSGEFGGESGVFVEQRVVLKAVVELADQAVEKVALGGCVPISVLAASSIVGVGSGGCPQ